MVKAIYNNTIIAESDATIVVENNHYFPPEDVNTEYLKKTNDTYTCPWKGVCDYYDVVVGDTVSEGAAWVYPKPTEAAQQITGYVAFWKDVAIVE